MKKLMIIAVFMFTAVTIAPVGLVAAQEERVQSDSRSVDVSDTQRDVRAVTDIRPIDRCSVVEAKIAKIIERIEANVKKKQQRYTEISQKVTRVIAAGEKQGVDVDKLRGDLRIFEEKVARFSAEARTLHSSLKLVQRYACGEDREKFKEALQEARAQLKVVRRVSLDIRTFVNDILIPDAREVLRKLNELQ